MLWPAGEDGADGTGSGQPSVARITETNLLLANEPGEIWSCIMYALYMKFPYLAQWNLISSFNMNLT